MAIRPLILAAMLASCSACTREEGSQQAAAHGEHLKPAELPSNPAVHAEVYVPIYSNLSYRSGEVTVELSAQLTIRNTDLRYPIVLESVRYYGGSGKLLRDELDTPKALGPMASTSFLVRKSDREGGVGANYLVRWRSREEVAEPLMEAAMADLSSSISLAFTSRGVTTHRVSHATLPE